MSQTHFATFFFLNNPPPPKTSPLPLPAALPTSGGRGDMEGRGRIGQANPDAAGRPNEELISTGRSKIGDLRTVSPHEGATVNGFGAGARREEIGRAHV